VINLEIKLLKAVHFCVLQMGNDYGLYQTSYTQQHWTNRKTKNKRKERKSQTNYTKNNEPNTYKLDTDEAWWTM